MSIKKYEFTGETKEWFGKTVALALEHIETEKMEE